MTTLEDARKRWLKEQPAYREFGIYLADQLKAEIRRHGILADVTSRPKDIDSVIKKLILKPEHTYESLGDKTGVRAIVRYKDEIAPVLEIAKRLFQRGDPENTSGRLKPNTFGYLSVHADVRLLAGDEQISKFSSDKFAAELGKAKILYDRITQVLGSKHAYTMNFSPYAGRYLHVFPRPGHLPHSNLPRRASWCSISWSHASLVPRVHSPRPQDPSSHSPTRHPGGTGCYPGRSHPDFRGGVATRGAGKTSAPAFGTLSAKSLAVGLYLGRGI